MMPPLLLLRADAGPGMGAGHVMRSLALAEAWMDEVAGEAAMITDSPERVVARVRASGVEVVPAAGPAGSERDLQHTLEVARGRGAACWVTDGYRFGAAYQSALRRDGAPLLSIDDGAATGVSAARLILDQNAGIDASLYAQRPSDSELLLGPRFALLRREFRQGGPRVPDLPDQVGRVLVVLGGGDASAAALLVLDALAVLRPKPAEVRVLIGPASSGSAVLRERARASGLAIEFVEGGSDLPELMAWAHLAISGGGSTCWELACLGIPSLVIELADNQHPVIAGLARAGVVERGGGLGELTAARLAARLAEVMRDPARRRVQSALGRAMVDGEGALRVARRIGALVAQGVES